MDSILFALATVPPPLISAVHHHQHFLNLLPHASTIRRFRRRAGNLFIDPVSVSRRWAALPSAVAGTTNSMPPRDVVYTVGDFMTKKEDLYVVKPTTTVDEALECLAEKRITGFPVIDDDWNLVPRPTTMNPAFAIVYVHVGVVSDYDLLALDSISGAGHANTSLFPDVDSSWKSFNEIQKLLGKTNGKVVGDLMTTVPLSVREATNLEDAVRLLLETKFRRLPVVDSDGKLVGIITRGNIVRAALQIKLAHERMSGDQN